MFGCGGVTSSPDPAPAPGPGPGPAPTGIESLNHIIFMVQENRSFDEYFGMLNAYRQANGMPQMSMAYPQLPRTQLSTAKEQCFRFT
jgi:phospholipase C